MNKIIFAFLIVFTVSSCCQTEQERRDIESRCRYQRTSATRFVSFSPERAFQGQIIDVAAFVTDKDLTFEGQSSSEKIINKENLDAITFDLVPFPLDALKKRDEQKEDFYQNLGVRHKIWTYEVLKCGVIDLHFKLIDKEGTTIVDQRRCMYIPFSFWFFFLSHPLEFSTLIISIIALIFTGVDCWIKISKCRRSKKINKRQK